MIKLKAIALMICVIGLLSGSIIFMAGSSSQLPVQHLESANARMQDVLQEKLINAETSIHAQGLELASDEKLINELSTVREKLLSMTPAELKKQSGNTWNNSVFERLNDWHDMRDSSIVRQNTSIDDIMHAPRGHMSDIAPVINWWGKSPDLILAFAAVPLKTGEISATLVANGAKGKQLQGGKRYDLEIPALAGTIKTQKAVFGHFAWEGKMYISVVTPVFKNGNFIGSTVIGFELSKDGLNMIERALPKYTRLMLVYSAPKLDAEKGQKVIYASSDESKSLLQSGRFHINANEHNDALIPYNAIKPNIVYTTSDSSNKRLAISRMPWIWDTEQESDIYFLTDLSNANRRNDILKRNVIIAGCLAALLGIILILMLISSIQRQMQRIRQGIAEAITSHNPIEDDIITSLMGENADDIGQFTIQRVETPDEDEESDDWTDMMMNLDEEPETKAEEKEITPEEIEKFKNEASGEDVRQLYDEYMRLRKENGISTPMDYDRFLRRLQRNADKIKQKYHCSTVHFEVHVSSGNVLLKPKIDKKA